jgi:type IV pilus assembly protein PilC
MPEFTYKAVDAQGREVKGALNAPSELELEDRLREMGLTLVRARPETGVSLFSFERITRKDLISFTLHLSTVLSAGIPLLTGLRDMAEQTTKRRLRQVIEQIAEDVRAGASLSEALGRHPKVFSELYVNMVHAGEASGNVEGVLNELTAFLEWQDDLAASVTQALLYPIVILVAGVMLVFFLLSFVLPRFLDVFAKAKVQLPLPTRILLGISGFFARYWLLLLLLAAGLVVLVIRLKRTPRGAMLWDRFKLNLPIFGGLIRRVALSRFAHHMGTLLKAGIDITEALWVAERVIGNAVLAQIIRNALVRVREGEPLSRTLEQSGEFPPLIVRMFQIGERTSSLELTLSKVSEHYDKEVPVTIKRIFSIFEPVVIVFLGAVVVGIALSMFLPMYQMIRLMSR